MNFIEDPKKFKRMAKIHKYWARKPWNLMKYMIETNSKKGDLVLDPFCGSGTIGLESILSGRNFIGYDLNPFSIFLSDITLRRDLNENKLQNAFDLLDKRIRNRILKLYKHEDAIILYSIPGPGNKKEYNLVLGDQKLHKTHKTFFNNLSIKYGMASDQNLIIPDAKFPSQFYKDRFSYKGVAKVSDLFSRNNLKALEILWTEINLLPKELIPVFKLVLSNTLLHVSKLKSENVRPLGVNNYWIPDDYIDENVYWRFTDRFKQFMSAKKEINMRMHAVAQNHVGSFKLECRTSIPTLHNSDESTDYILTDPPYGDVIQYSELSFVWNTWLESPQDIKNELIINPVQNKSAEFFLDNLDKFITESFRVLKWNKKITLCFQNKDPRIWFEVAYSAARAGFDLSSIEAFDYLGNPFNKNWSSKSPKMDLYVTFTKSKFKVRQPNSILSFNLKDIMTESKQCIAPDGVHEIKDAYSNFIACAIIAIVKAKKIPTYQKKDLDEIIMKLNG